MVVVEGGVVEYSAGASAGVGGRGGVGPVVVKMDGNGLSCWGMGGKEGGYSTTTICP